MENMWRAELKDSSMWNGVTSDHERDLYERARNAANEAEREGDAQLQAAVAAAGTMNQAVVTPTRLHFWSLKFHCQRLEAAYCRKATTNTESYDYLPLLLKTALCLPHLYLILKCVVASSEHFSFKTKLVSSNLLELTFRELWSIGGTLGCLFVVGIQLIWPIWYRSNRGITLKYLLMSLWMWESVSLFLNTNEEVLVFREVAFVNVFMSAIHHVPFSSHLKLRSLGGALQAVAIVCRRVDLKMCLPLLSIALAGHIGGLGLAYVLDRYSRKRFLKSMPVWQLDELSGTHSQAQFYLSYRASLSKQMWGIFYPELRENQQLPDKDVTMPRRALGGFAGGFGGVSSLKCTQPVSSTLPPLSFSSSFSRDGSSGASSGNWGGVGLGNTGTSCCEVVSNACDRSGKRMTPPVQRGTVATTSAYSQAGLELLHSEYTPDYTRSRPLRGAVLSSYS